MSSQIGHKTYTGYFKESMDAIDALEELIVDIQNAMGMSKSEVIRQLIRRAAISWHQELTEQKKVDPFRGELVKFVEAKRKERNIQALLEEAYERAGREKFIEWSQNTEGVDQEVVEDFLSRYEAPGELTRTYQRRSWLASLLSDGQPHRTDEIRKAAVECSMIKDTETDWTDLRQIATRAGFTGHSERGTWQSSSKSPLNA